MMRLYLAGPMTGLPERNFPAFNAEAARLRALGFDIVNPAEIHNGASMSWHDCMKVDIPLLLTCDGIALMEGWEQSKGARLERHYAEELDMFVLQASLIQAA